MSLDEATASDLQRSHQFSPVPSPPSTAQFSYSYSNIGSPQIGSPNQSYAHLTNQMQDFHLHSGAGSPGPPSGAASPEMRNENYDIKPYIHQEDMNPYIYYPSPHEQHHQQDINYQNPPSIPKIQVYTPEEALSPQFYPPDEQMGQDGQQEMNNMFDFDNAMIEQQLLEDENVQATMDGMYSYVYPHSWIKGNQRERDSGACTNLYPQRSWLKGFVTFLMRKVLACEGAGLSLNIIGWTDVGHMMHVLANYIYNLKFHWLNLVSSRSLKIKRSQNGKFDFIKI